MNTSAFIERCMKQKGICEAINKGFFTFDILTECFIKGLDTDHTELEIKQNEERLGFDENATKMGAQITSSLESVLPHLSSSKPQEDEVLERYEVIESLGKGGMGVVERVKDLLLGREVALKKIHVSSSKIHNFPQKQQMMSWRLKTEASITAILEHPNIVPLYDLERKQDGEIRFTMRKVEGATLSQLLKEKRQGATLYDEEELLLIYLKVCDAIRYAHSRGIIHRDLKPENIMVGQFGEVYVMDWGIAKAKETSKPFLEGEPESDFSWSKEPWQTIGGLGTPGYMPPEQKKDASQVSYTADIYALGKILRECFTLTTPVEEFHEILAQYHLQKDFQKREEQFEKILSQKVPLDIQAIVEKATREKVEERYETVRELEQDVERYLKNVRVSVRDYSFFEIFRKWYQRNRFRILTGISIFLLFLFFLVSFFLEKQRVKQRQFQVAFLKAQKLKAKANQYQGKYIISFQIEHLLQALNSINVALLNQLKNEKAEQEKLMVGKKLIELCCENKDYQLARYVAKEMRSLSLLSSEEKVQLEKKVHQEQNRTLMQHKQRLDYWVEVLKNPDKGMKEFALIEISKMPEDEIFQELLTILKEGTNYFLHQRRRTVKQDEFYEFIVEALGWLGNPAAKESLLEALNKMEKKLRSIDIEKRPSADIDFMVLLAKSLGYILAPDTAELLGEIRLKMGSRGVFSQRTNLVFRNLALLEKLEEKEPSTAIGYYQRALLFHDIGKLEKAIQDCTNAISLNPKFAKAYHTRGFLKYLDFKFKEAIDDLNFALKLNQKDAYAYNIRALSKVGLGDSDGALKDLNYALKLAPKLVDAYLNRGVILSGRKESLAAIRDFNQAILLAPKRAEIYRNRSIAKRELLDFTGAIKDIEIALSLNQEDPINYHELGTFKIDIGDINGAIEAYTKAIQLNPKYENAYLNRGRVKGLKKNYQEAIKDLNEVIRLNPKSSRAFLQRGSMKQALRDYQGAKRDYNRSIKLNPKAPAAFAKRGLFRKQTNRLKLALEDYDQAIRLEPKHSDFYTNRGTIKELQQNFKGALKDYNQAILLNPRDSFAYYNRGNTKLKMNDLMGTIHDSQKALNINPKMAYAYFNLGVALQRMRQWEKAIEAFKKGLSLTPNKQISGMYSDIFLERSIQRYRRKEYSLAHADLLQFQKIAPKDHPQLAKIDGMLKKIEALLKKTVKENSK